MGILLGALYWATGFVMVMAAASAVGFGLNMLIALAKVGIRSQNIFLAGGYFVAGALSASVVWLGFFVAGWIGDKTDYAGQWGLIAGAIFPGILALGIIPHFIRIAIAQTSGMNIE